jgi:anti-sigma factor (TIGR02949 family)
MDCSGIADHLSPLADGELQQEMAEEVRAHLEQCPDCTRLLREHMTIKQLLPRKLPFEKAPPGLRAAILDHLDSWPINDMFHALFVRLRAQPFLASGVAVTAFLAVFAGVLLVMNSHRLPPLVREAIAHHAVASQHALQVPGSDARQIAQILKERFKRDISVPDLSDRDCTLMGAGRCPVCDRSAVEIRYGHPKANVTLLVISQAREEDFTNLCKPETLRTKTIDGETYFYCETRSCRAILWWQGDDIVIMTSCLALPAPFETARQVRGTSFPHGI